MLSVPEMLEELRNPYLTQLKDEIQGIDSATLHRDILDWHKDAGQDLYDRMALVSFNVSAESWPYRVKSMRGMLQHFRRSLRGRLSAQRNVKPSAIAEKQLSAKIELLRGLELQLTAKLELMSSALSRHQIRPAISRTSIQD